MKVLKILKVTLIAVSLSSIAALAVILILIYRSITEEPEKPQPIRQLMQFYEEHPYPSFTLEDCRFSHPVSNQLCISTTFHTEDSRSVLGDALQLKSEIEDFLEAHPELYTGLLFDYTLSTDSAYGYIRISNYDPESGELTNPYSMLAYGDFHGALGSAESFRECSMFEHLYFLDYQYFDDFSVFDSQVNLKGIQLIACDKITETDISYLQKTHPDCIITT